MKYNDLELIKMGRACAPAEWMIADPMTKAEHTKKYELCKQEWADAIQSRLRSEVVNAVTHTRAGDEILYDIVRNAANRYNFKRF
jgi:hypothetical protein